MSNSVTSKTVLIPSSSNNMSISAALGPHRSAILKKMDISSVCDGLYLSDYESLTFDKILKLNISLVINCAAELPSLELPEPKIETLRLSLYDAPTENISKCLDSCADRINQVKISGSNTLVHCALGISRSVTICLAYLIKYEGKTLLEAYNYLKEKRPIIHPNDGFWRQLIAYELEVRGKTTVKMIVYPMGSTPDVYRKHQQTRRFNFR